MGGVGAQGRKHVMCCTGCTKGFATAAFPLTYISQLQHGAKVNHDNSNNDNGVYAFWLTMSQVRARVSLVFPEQSGLGTPEC